MRQGKFYSDISMNNSKLNVVLHRDGDYEPVTLDQDKCLIRTVHDNIKIDCCAIFNGPYGTALRSYTDNVLVNGEPSAARWLSAGDQIQLPCSTRIEVKAVTIVRPQPLSPVADELSVPESGLDRLGAVESMLAPVDKPNETPFAATELEEEETFHSPFSPDLPEAEASTTEPEDPTADDLESIFARMGVTNVGSITNPTTAPAEPVASSTEEATSAEETAAAPTQDPQPDAVESVRHEIESLFADVPATQQLTDTSPVEPVVTVKTSTADLSDPVAEPIAADPLAELPSDLRNQLNSLVSSLEDESSAMTKNESVVESLAPAAAAATAAAVAASIPVISDLVKPESVPQPTGEQVTEATSTSLPQFNPAHLKSQPIASEEAAEEAKPVRDESISNMFEDAMRTIQNESKAAEPAAAVESDNPVSPVETSAVQEPSSDLSAAPVAAEPPAEKPQSRSVADILGAMGMEVPGDDEAGYEEPKTPASPAPTPMQTQETQSVSRGGAFAETQSTSAAPAVSDATDGEAEDDIQAYMNKLLNRSAPEPKPAAAAASETETVTETVTQTATATETATESETVSPYNPMPVVESDEPPAMLSPEEFVPSHKPSRPQNYDKLREIANTSSRSAIDRSHRRAQKESVAMKILFAAIAMILAGVSCWIGQNIVASVFMAVTAMCIASCFLKQKAPRKPKGHQA